MTKFLLALAFSLAPVFLNAQTIVEGTIKVKLIPNATHYSPFKHPRS